MHSGLACVLKIIVTIRKITGYYIWHVISYDISGGVE